MELRAKEESSARRQLPKLKSLLKKYRHVKTMQSSLLQLSELASSVTDMPSFYPALDDVIRTVLIADSFFIVLTDQQNKLSLAYSHNPQERRLLSRLEHQHWLESLTGMVFAAKQPFHCNAAQRKALAKSGDIVVYGSACVDWLGIPLLRGNQIIGVLALQSYSEGHYFDDQDCQLLEFIAEYFVTAIDRVQSRELLEKSIQQRTQKLTQANQQLQAEIAERQKVEKIHQAMLAISEITASINEMAPFYRALHHEISRLIQADNLYIALLSEDRKTLEFPYYVDEKLINPAARPLAQGLTEFVLDTAKPVLIRANELYILQDDGVIRSQRAANLLQQPRRSKAWLAAPLMISGAVVGVLAIQHYHDSQAFQQSDLALLRFVSQHVATAIERKREQLNRRNQQRELERLVNERTRELQASNQKLRMQIEERRKVEERLYHDAHHDVLTKLPNRAMLSARLEQALKHLKRHPDHKFALLFIDLDRFKIINDTLGHQAGDKFLIEVAARLRQCIRDNDVLARLGGDEFVILLDSLANQDDIEDIASRIIDSIEQPFDFDGNQLHSSASIGITLCNNEYSDANEMLRDADAAMYQAKSMGRGRYMFFDVSMREQLIASLTLEQELRIAVKQQQFELHYQEISELDSASVIGFEALLRWRHPEKGLLTPGDFLFSAEETGMIAEIETWVVEQACRQIRQWRQHPEYHSAFVSINLSGRQLTQASQLQALITLLKQQNIELQRLILEFDEAAFSQHPELALKGLRKLKALGVKLALDDYGAGLSSFNFIHSYPFEFIKLDRSFIRALNSSDKNLCLIKALHDLGDKFGYRLVAEGIESREIMQKVLAAGCEFGQGYYLNRPGKMSQDDDNDALISCA